MQNPEARWLHKYMAENGIRNVCAVPLEKIVWGGGPPDPQSDLWQKAAQKAERRWVQRLRTLHLRGYNKCMPGGQKALPYAYYLHTDSSGYCRPQHGPEVPA